MSLTPDWLKETHPSTIVEFLRVREVLKATRFHHMVHMAWWFKLTLRTMPARVTKTGQVKKARQTLTTLGWEQGYRSISDKPAAPPQKCMRGKRKHFSSEASWQIKSMQNLLKRMGLLWFTHPRLQTVPSFLISAAHRSPPPARSVLVNDSRLAPRAVVSWLDMDCNRGWSLTLENATFWIVDSVQFILINKWTGCHSQFVLNQNSQLNSLTAGQDGPGFDL